MKTAFIVMTLVVATGCGGAETPNTPNTYNLTLEVENTANDERVCALTYVYGDVIGSIVDARLIAPGEVRSGVLAVEDGAEVTVKASCWHPGNTNMRASDSRTTLPIHGDATCHAFYDEADGPHITVPCW